MQSVNTRTKTSEIFLHQKQEEKFELFEKSKTIIFVIQTKSCKSNQFEGEFESN